MNTHFTCTPEEMAEAAAIVRREPYPVVIVHPTPQCEHGVEVTGYCGACEDPTCEHGIDRLMHWCPTCDGGVAQWF